MPKRKKDFIDKKSAQTFQLVHRSQRDPLIVNEEIGQHVLHPVEDTNERSNNRDGLHKFGIFYNDDYNYLQHLKNVNEVTVFEPTECVYRSMNDETTSKNSADTTETSNKSKKLTLPSTLFETAGVRLDIGLLNQAAPISGPHPELDPDIIAALDNDFDFEDPEATLEDDFVTLANGPDVHEYREPARESDASSDLSSESSDADEASVAPSRFTNYSMTSATIKRGDGLRLLDDRFEKFYEDYDQQHIGELELEFYENISITIFEDEEIFGGDIEPDSHRMRLLLEEFEKKQREKRERFSRIVSEKDEQIATWNVSDDEPCEKIFINDQNRNDKWDCKTVISTYSDKFNHPTLIKESCRIKLGSKSGLPKESKKRLAKKHPVQVDQEMDVDSVCSSTVSSIRPKNETPEERKLRKQQIRIIRKERRLEKKSNKLAFKEEARQLKLNNNNMPIEAVRLV